MVGADNWKVRYNKKTSSFYAVDEHHDENPDERTLCCPDKEYVSQIQNPADIPRINEGFVRLHESPNTGSPNYNWIFFDRAGEVKEDFSPFKCDKNYRIFRGGKCGLCKIDEE